MKINNINTFAVTTLGTLALTLTANLPHTSVQAQSNNEVQFICAESFDPQSGKSTPTTFAWGSRGKISFVRWSSKAFENSSENSSFTPQKRCEIASPNFQTAYENNTLGLITNGRKNNQPVICTSQEYGGECETVLFTLRPEDNSLNVLKHFRQILNGEQIGPIKQSSDVPQIYYQVDIENFLNTAPVE